MNDTSAILGLNIDDKILMLICMLRKAISPIVSEIVMFLQHVQTQNVNDVAIKNLLSDSLICLKFLAPSGNAKTKFRAAISRFVDFE